MSSKLLRTRQNEMARLRSNDLGFGAFFQLSGYRVNRPVEDARRKLPRTPFLGSFRIAGHLAEIRE